MKTRFTRFTAGGAIVALAVAAMSCGEVARQGRSPSMITIMRMEGSSGAKPGTFGGTLSSDVQTFVKTTVNGQDVSVPTIFTDLGRADFALILKDQGAPGVTASPSSLNQVTFSRYRVEYRRADGRNTAGADVPYPFDGAVTFTVQIGSAITATFELVRAQAKEEAPLLALIGGGGQNSIATIADVTFYGQDQAGNAVTAVGSISVTFADWGDPTS